MAYYKPLLVFMAYAAVSSCSEDCVYNLKRGKKSFLFDLTSFKQLKTVHFTELNNYFSINIKLCKVNEQSLTCDGSNGSSVCLVKNKTYTFDIGSIIKEAKVNAKNQLFMSFEGNYLCNNNQKYTTDITFICNKTVNEDKVVYKSGINACKYIIEWTSVAVCPVDDFEIRKMCSLSVSIPSTSYKFIVDLNPLRRLIDNYVVEKENRRFEVNICGRLTDNSKCIGHITTICDITDVNNPQVYIEGYKYDKLTFMSESRSLKLIQYDLATKKKQGRRAEFIFTCDENIPPEKTKPKVLVEENYFLNTQNVAHVTYFEVATSLVCIPRQFAFQCEIFTNTARFNLKPLQKRIGNWIVNNEKDGGKFYLNICNYLNQYDEAIPTSCSGEKTSACYVDKFGKGTPIGSTQTSLQYGSDGSILLNYIDGINCKNSVLKWSTLVNFTCSDDSELIHFSTNLTSCTHIFHWKSPEACKKMFEKNDKCMVTHPEYSDIKYNMSSLKYKNFNVEDDDKLHFRFSICSTLKTPCNNNLDAAACLSINGNELNIGLFTDEIVFDNGKIYLSMQGEACIDNGPNSVTTIRFVCDYSDSQHIYPKTNLPECIFEFIIYTRNACTPRQSKINCTVTNQSGNVFDLSQLTKLNSNYEIPIDSKKTIILNICHSVINNDINTVNCLFDSGICLHDKDILFFSDRYKNIGFVKNGPYTTAHNKIILEMADGFFNVSSVIEFICSYEKNGPKLTNKENHRYEFQWFTPLVCESHGQNEEVTGIDDLIKSKNSVVINRINYSLYLCPKYDIDIKCNLEDSKITGRTVILTINNTQTKKYALSQNSIFHYYSEYYCNYKNKGEIKFRFICGFELQKPKINKIGCTTYVLIIDPEICEEKLKCSTNLYDLSPLKGSYIVNYNKTVKYFINMCIPGNDGVGIIMELNRKNHTAGYQVQSLQKDLDGSVEVVFKDGNYTNDSCLNSRLPIHIKFECDNTVFKEEPIFVESNNKCKVKFLWRTRHICPRQLIEFIVNETCSAIIKGDNKSFEDGRTIHMENILDVKEFLDNSTKLFYHVNFCNKSVCTTNKSKCYENMTLQYDLYNKQMIANFKNIFDFTNVDILISCSGANGDSEAYQVISFKNSVVINTYSKHMCLINYQINHLTEELFLTTTTSITNVKNKISSNFEDFDRDPSTVMNTYLSSTESIKQVLSITEDQIKKSNIYPNENNITLKQKYEITASSDYFTSTVRSYKTAKKESSGTSFYSGMFIFIIFVLLLVWFYQWRILKVSLKRCNYWPLVRRRFRAYHNHEHL